MGIAARYFARAYPRAVVLAVEPDEDNLVVCRQNTEVCANICVVPTALGGRSGCVNLEHGNGNADRGRTERSDHGIPITVIAELKDPDPQWRVADRQGRCRGLREGRVLRRDRLGLRAACDHRRNRTTGCCRATEPAFRCRTSSCASGGDDLVGPQPDALQVPRRIREGRHVALADEGASQGGAVRVTRRPSFSCRHRENRHSRWASRPQMKTGFTSAGAA